MKNKKNFKLLVFILLAITALSCKKTPDLDQSADPTSTFKSNAYKSFVGHPAGLQTNLRMYGYLQTWGTSYAQELDNINLDQLTDLCISFIKDRKSVV